MPVLPVLAAAALLLAARTPAAPREPAGERLVKLEDDLARDRRDARGIADLAGVDALADEAPDLARLAGVLARTADDRGADPEVRALARFRLAAVERARGNVQRSAAQRRRLGFVEAYLVAGPFDDEGRRGFDAVYPPERGVDLAVEMPGKVRPVSWRPLPAEAVSEGFVHLGATVTPSREVVAYALAVVDAPRDERVSLWLGASGAAKVFVNGALVVADRAYHPARLDQRGATVSLRKGPNRILVKLCHSEGRMGFYLRLADERGEGRSLPAGDPAAAPQAPGAAPQPIAGAVVALERRAAAARGKRDEAEARLALALALDERRAFDVREPRAAIEARRAAELAPRSVQVRLAAARLEEDRGRRRAQVEAVLAVAPGDPVALAALADDELDQDRPHPAVRLLERAVRAAPGWPAPRVALAEALARMGADVRGAREARRGRPRLPHRARRGPVRRPRRPPARARRGGRRPAPDPARAAARRPRGPRRPRAAPRRPRRRGRRRGAPRRGAPPRPVRSRGAPRPRRAARRERPGGGGGGAVRGGGPARARRRRPPGPPRPGAPRRSGGSPRRRPTSSAPSSCGPRAPS